jgi:hypothetical protein
MNCLNARWPRGSAPTPGIPAFWSVLQSKMSQAQYM